MKEKFDAIIDKLGQEKAGKPLSDAVDNQKNQEDKKAEAPMQLWSDSGKLTWEAAEAEYALNANSEDSSQTGGDGKTAHPNSGALDLARQSQLLADDSAETAITKFYKFSMQLGKERCTFIADPGTAAALAVVLASTKACKIKPRVDCGEYGGVVYDAGQGSEAASKPHVRYPPLRDSGNHPKTMIKGSLKSFTSSGTGKILAMPPAHVYFVLDGGRHGNEDKLMKGFRKAPILNDFLKISQGTNVLKTLNHFWTCSFPRSQVFEWGTAPNSLQARCPIQKIEIENYENEHSKIWLTAFFVSDAKFQSSSTSFR